MHDRPPHPDPKTSIIGPSVTRVAGGALAEPSSRPPRTGSARGMPAAVLGLVLAGCAGAAGAPAGAPGGGPAVQEGPRTVQAGAPGEASRTLSSEERPVLPHLPHTEADVRFMRNMIHHHAQALEMAGLVSGRTESRDILLLADRIRRSQVDEIALMERWLAVRGEDAPEWREGRDEHGTHDAHDQRAADPEREHAHDPPDHEGPALMAGMLSPEQLARLASARGDEFDRLFLEYMIFHHDGAIRMVEELFSVPGSGQDSEIFRFASHVEADQSIEIGRMERMLRARRAAEDR
jgi:uncharacterized protein (DUF305 family)